MYLKHCLMSCRRTTRSFELYHQGDHTGRHSTLCFPIAIGSFMSALLTWDSIYYSAWERGEAEGMSDMRTQDTRGFILESSQGCSEYHMSMVCLVLIVRQINCATAIPVANIISHEPS
jgi:hypothetical protein